MLLTWLFLDLLIRFWPFRAAFSGSAKVLDVELYVASERDGRSFGKLLLDIATGENARDVPEFLVVERIVFAGRGVKWHDDRAVIGCVVNFIKCQ